MKMWHCAFPNCGGCCFHLGFVSMALAGGIPSPDIVPGWFADISDWSANWFPARMVHLAVLGVSLAILGNQDLLSTSDF